MSAALEFEAAGGSRAEVDGLLDTSIRAVEELLSTSDEITLFARMKSAGSQVLQHRTIFIKPSVVGVPVESEGGDRKFSHHPYEPKMQLVIQALQTRGVYLDDLVVDVGTVSQSQMRAWPYVIITIPRLNAQIAVSNQKGQAIFVAQPATDLMDWAVFNKQLAGAPGTRFAHVQRIVCNGAWQPKMLDWVFGDAQATGAKVSLPGFVRAHRSGTYALSEGMIVEMAKLYRERHPERQWPSQNSGDVDRDIVTAVTGNPDWQPENWAKINTAGVQNLRGLKNSGSLAEILRRNGCAYDLTEEMIAKMANLYRLGDKNLQWPSITSGEVAHEVVVAVTGDTLWQRETWLGFDATSKRGGRGLTRKMTLPQLLRANGCHYDLSEEVVLKMARLWRQAHPERHWPTAEAGTIPKEIVLAAVGCEHWQQESWASVNHAFRKGVRGLRGPTSLGKFLMSHGCYYDQLTEERIVAMALLWSKRDPQGRLPGKESGVIPHDIVVEVFGDPLWQRETWMNINAVCKIGGRGLGEKTSLRQLWDKHLSDVATTSASKTVRPRLGL